MVCSLMHISKELQKKVQKDYFFIKGQLDIDCNYFIQKIKQGVEEKENMSYRTNVKGKMTSWKFFNEDQNFLKILRKFINYIDDNYTFPPYSVKDSWGFINLPGEKTNFHNHHEAIFSGVIYLNDCEQPLLFNEINEKIDPKPGSFGLFSSWLYHGCNVNDTDNCKFGISFNMNEQFPW
mgnify:FL=1